MLFKGQPVESALQGWSNGKDTVTIFSIFILGEQLPPQFYVMYRIKSKLIDNTSKNFDTIEQAYKFYCQTLRKYNLDKN